MEKRLSSRKASRFTFLSFGTAGFIVAWLAFACYAIDYLISH